MKVNKGSFMYLKKIETDWLKIPTDDAPEFGKELLPVCPTLQG